MSAGALSGPAALQAAPDGEDVTVLDASLPVRGEAQALAAALRQAGHAPLALVAAAPEAEPPEDASLGFCDAWLRLGRTEGRVSGDLERFYRDGVSRAEWRARLRTQALAGGAAPLPPAPDRPEPARPMSVLFVGGPCAMFLPLERAIASAGGRVRGALTSFSAFDHFHDEDYDALIVNATTDVEAGLSLCAALRRNARLHDLPLLTIVARDDPGAGAAAAQRSAATLTRLGEDAKAPALWLMEQMRAARARAGVEAALLESPLRRARAEAFDPDAFAAHLNTLAHAHYEAGRDLAVGALRLYGGAENGAWRAGFAEMVSLSSRLIRSCDSAAPNGSHTIVFAFPCLTAAHAQTALDRVIAVCDCTTFAAGHAGAGPVTFRRWATELAPGESGNALLARLLDADGRSTL